MNLLCNLCEEEFDFENIAITSCQTSYGVCKQCFNYKCQQCPTPISRRTQYVDDSDNIELLPLCELCKESRRDLGLVNCQDCVKVKLFVRMMGCLDTSFYPSHFVQKCISCTKIN